MTIWSKHWLIDFLLVGQMAKSGKSDEAVKAVDQHCWELLRLRGKSFFYLKTGGRKILKVSQKMSASTTDLKKRTVRRLENVEHPRKFRMRKNASERRTHWPNWFLDTASEHQLSIILMMKELYARARIFQQGFILTIGSTNNNLAYSYCQWTINQSSLTILTLGKAWNSRKFSAVNFEGNKTAIPGIFRAWIFQNALAQNSWLDKLQIH